MFTIILNIFFMKITVVPTAGLCNRINSITSAVLYQEQHPDSIVQLFWWKTHDCCAEFNDLFEKKYIPLKIEEMNSILKNRPGSRRNLYIPKLFRFIFYDYELNPLSKPSDFEKLTFGKKNIFIPAVNNFCSLILQSSLSKMFVPIPKLQKRIDNITKDWENNVIGLHIRRTDNMHAIEHSPIHRFYSIIDDEIQNNASIRFYLATDDEFIKKEFCAKYGKRIITMNLNLSRNSIEGMQDAVVDLYCLGSTIKIIGSFHSTYSIVASQLHNIKLIV